MKGDSIPDEPAAASDADAEPPSSPVIRLIDRRAPGGSAAEIPIDLRGLEAWMRRLATLLDTPIEVTVALLDDAEMDRLHRAHSGVPGTTDVLGFPGDDDGGVTGDLAVGVEVAAREAGARGRSIESELVLYVVHGLLHLLGERDHDAASRRRMVDAQDRLLAAMGLPRTDEIAAADEVEAPETTP